MNTQTQTGGETPTPDSAGGANDWAALRVSLAGGDATRAQLLETMQGPEALFERLSATPPDWREQMAGGDADALAFLNKYADAPQAMKAWRSLQTKMSEGGRIQLPGENATPEELADYAKAMGIPPAPDGFEVKAQPPQGYEISETDKAFLGNMTKQLHEAMSKGARPGDLVNLAHQLYYDAAAQSIVSAENAAADRAYENEQVLRKLWGQKFEDNVKFAIAGAKHFFPGSDDEFQTLMGTKLETGEALFDNALVQRMFAQIGLEFAEDPNVTALRDRNSGFDIDKRIAEIKAMRNGSSAQQTEYAKLAAPGGELEKLINAKTRTRAA